MNLQASALRYPVRGSVVCRYAGQLALLHAGLTTAPFSVALLYRDFPVAGRYAAVAGVLAIAGLIAARRPAPERAMPHEAMVLAAIFFLGAPLAMTFPLMASGLSFVDAVFEAISGATTTGLSTLQGVETRSPPFLFGRAWMQWYGGLGIVVFSAALILRPGPTTKSLMATEDEQDDLIGGSKALARRVVRVYVALTMLGIAALAATGTPVFKAVVYAMAAVSTGGYAPDDASLAAFPSRAGPCIVLVLSFAGALPLVLYRALRHRGALLRLHVAQAATLAAACLLVGPALSAMLPSDQSPAYHGFLTAVSAQTTAGFSTAPSADLPAGGKALLVCSMLLGGCVGSTAGGIKVLRLLILFQCLRVMIARTGTARHAVIAPRLAGKKLEPNEINDTLVILTLFLILAAASWLPFVIAGHDPLDALFEVASATATVGLSTGVTAPDLATGLKAVLCIDMLMGRLEILAWLAILHPRAWIGRGGGRK